MALPQKGTSFLPWKQSLERTLGGRAKDLSILASCLSQGGFLSILVYRHGDNAIGSLTDQITIPVKGLASLASHLSCVQQACTLPVSAFKYQVQLDTSEM